VSEWKAVRLSEFCRTGTGGTPSRSNLERYYEGGTIPWVKSGELRESVINETEEHITEAALRETNVKLIPAGALLLAMYGATVGRLGILGVEATTNQAVCHIVPDPKAAEVRFLFHALSNQVANLVARAVGGAQPNISQGIVKDLKLALPPLAEQRRIAEVLDRAEALRAKRRAPLAQLDSLTQSLFLDLFGDPIKNPHGFQVRPMIELIDPLRPISYGILMPGPDQVEGVKYVRVVDMKNGGIDLSGIRKTTEAMSNSFRRSLLKPADLLMSIRGHVGRFAVVPPELDGANITQDTARLAIVGASSVFVRECLRAEGFQRWMAKHTKGVAVRGINLGDVKLMPVILPPRPTQDKFARQANTVEKLNTAQRASLAELDALFATLQYRAFRGEL
jgi:type I restriction enzyme S subunit